MLTIGQVIEFLLDNGENIAGVNKGVGYTWLRLCNTGTFYVTLTKQGELYASRQSYRPESMVYLDSLDDLDSLHYLP